jgi:hypothetical protein
VRAIIIGLLLLEITPMIANAIKATANAPTIINTFLLRLPGFVATA